MSYYKGELSGYLQSDEGRSSVVSKDFRSTIKKLMPSIKRTILSNDKIVEYHATSQAKVDGAKQATNYINHVLVPKCNAENAVHDMLFDALVYGTGILKWSAYEQIKPVVEEYTNQSDEDAIGLLDPEAADIVNYEQIKETDPDALTANPQARRHSYQRRVKQTDIKIMLEAVPIGSFLIYPGATDIEDAPIVGECMEMTRSELVARGYNRDDVARLSRHTGGSYKDKIDTDLSDRDYDGAMSNAMETVEIYEVYVKLDLDDDGIAEIHRIVLGEDGRQGQGKRYIILDTEEVPEAPYSKNVIERNPHEFDGISIFDDLEDIQNIKTYFLRGTIDNLAWQNNPTFGVDLSQVEDEEAAFNLEFGKPILMRDGANVSQALQQLTIPFVGNHSYEMLGYLDNEIKQRTGITDASGGVDPQSFQNMSATSANLISESGIAQAETIIRSLTRGGLRDAFRGILRLVVAHNPGAVDVRIGERWERYDPNEWDADMDVTINVGLGAGSRERDLSVLQIILGLQREILNTAGFVNPIVKPIQLYNTLAKITETAGFPSSDPYFTSPDPQEIQQRIEADQSKPDPAQQKITMQMQLEQAKAQAKQMIEEAQMQADLTVKQQELQNQVQLEQMRAEHHKRTEELKAHIELLKHRDNLELEREKAANAAANRHPHVVPVRVDDEGFYAG